jgi:hypothetical protein
VKFVHRRLPLLIERSGLHGRFPLVDPAPDRSSRTVEVTIPVEKSNGSAVLKPGIAVVSIQA